MENSDMKPECIKSTPDARGYTFDSERNPMIKQYEQMRYDRVLYKFQTANSTKDCNATASSVNIKPTSISLIGTEVIGQDDIGPLLPSDHFGLFATFVIV